MKELIEAGIIYPYTEVMFPRYGNVGVLVACGDGHHFGDLHRALSRRVKHIHPCTVNGGALLFDPRFEDERYSSEELRLKRQFALEDIEQSLHVKQAKHVLIHVHFPCGKGGLCGKHSAADMLASAGRAHETISVYLHGKAGFKFVVVTPLFHATGVEGKPIFGVDIQLARRLP